MKEEKKICAKCHIELGVKKVNGQWTYYCDCGDWVTNHCANILDMDSSESFKDWTEK